MSDAKSSELAHIPLAQSLWRGFRCRCPRCGEGRLFRSYLKVADKCPRCAEAFHYHRADDLPAYLVMVIVGHVVVALTLWLERAYQPTFLVHAVIELPLTVILSLALLEPVKGAVVALQWHAGMHGFAGATGRSTPVHRELHRELPVAVQPD